MEIFFYVGLLMGHGLLRPIPALEEESKGWGFRTGWRREDKILEHDGAAGNHCRPSPKPPPYTPWPTLPCPLYAPTTRSSAAWCPWWCGPGAAITLQELQLVQHQHDLHTVPEPFMTVEWRYCCHKWSIRLYSILTTGNFIMLFW